ncbi:diguanylate cyclase/phosphodiesterase (GGDEF & EAL domain) with PAS/PAC sensor(s) [Actinokineospora spheciospongiae]|uniref:Diguanylate cyclase/phosphodiesterase (GGDEF & EAL domain) with PAS/PAC sensor(S) n=1 Tax=Actinokineospora spheciospongiae TaxID=909613 RepID=W7J3U5_9PSEU|nr:FG-GAP-like repeat-containing protein [Actinokineospora spheciospongiae]EWC60804.1 diguanylate cyclase/phosphodiesterase (GGDEF & EAL domain) with PAS/PAC sensor(s) [Actinokineospora spheciospongiae]
MSRTLEAPGRAEVEQAGGECATGLRCGTFEVDAGGQATYRLAIAVPPGINGAQPDLALVYGHHRRNGALGVGWDLAGRSAISRVKATCAVDGFTGAVTFGPDDRFALDGRRLVAVDGAYHAPGAVYGTELGDHSRVVAGDTPAEGFRVTTRSGAVHHYGSTPQSQVLAGAHVCVWALSSTEDLDGNRVEYTYSPAASGSRYLSRIAYTARADGTAANRFVDFTYEPRPDPITEAVGGHLLTTELRLARITVSVAGEVVRTWDLAYGVSAASGLSVLTSATESGAAADGSPALPGTAFTWRDSALPRFAVGEPCWIGPDVPGVPDVTVVSVTGSGRTDLARFWTDEDGNLGVSTWLATAAGTFTHGHDDVLGAFPPRHHVLAADLDGNGRTDLVVAYADGPRQRLRFAVFLATGTGFAAAGEPFDTGTAWDATHLAFFAMDVSGDGRTDIVQAYSSPDPERGEVFALRTHRSEYGTGGTFSAATTSVTGDPARLPGLLGCWPMDVDGNGVVDLVRAWRDGDDRIAVAGYVSVCAAGGGVSFGRVVHSSLPGHAGAAQVALLPVDVNGDGVQDLLQVWEEPGRDSVTSHLSVLVSTGAGAFTRGADAEFPGLALSDGAVFAADLNGNATTAVVWQGRTADEIVFTPFVASPSGVYRRLPSFSGGPVGVGADRSVFLPVDVNGDGRADLVRLDALGEGAVRATPYLSAGAPLDVITGITTPLGERVTIDYAPLSDPEVYEVSRTPRFPDATALRHPGPLTPTVGPVQRVLGSALYVVSAHERSTDPGRNRFPLTDRRRSTYRDAALDLTGRGWLGFASRTVLDVGTGLRTTTAYRQDFPFTGRVAEVRVEAVPVPGGDPRVPPGSPPLLLSTSTCAYDSRTTGPVVEVLLTSTLESHYDYGADRFDRAYAHRFGYDEFGNRTLDADLGQVDPAGVPVRPGEAVYRHRLYDNVTTPTGWSLGHLRYDKLTANADDPDTTAFVEGDHSLRRYDLAPGTHHVVSAGGWDDTSGAFLRTAYEYDRFGNRVAETPPGGRTTRHDYDPDHHTYPMRTVHPPDDHGVSLVEWFGHDPRFGARIAHVDANGQVSVEALDAFGRPALRQVPVDPGTTDPNAVPACVTGTGELRRRLRAAPVVTVERTTRRSRAGGEQVVVVEALQAFPTDVGRSWATTRTLVDGRDLTRRTERETGQRRGAVVELTDHDARGRPVRRSLPFFATDPVPASVTTRYDVLGRRIGHDVPTDAGTSSTTWYHGPRGVVTETTADAVRRLVHRRYAGTDRVRLVVADPDGLAARTAFGFDPLGRPVRAVDPPTATTPTGVATTITRDSLGRRGTYDCPDLNPVPAPGRVAVRHRYDPATGLPAGETDAAGGTTEHTHDHLRRVVGTRLSDGRTIEYAYDLADTPYGLGRLCGVLVRDAQGAVQSRREFAHDRRGDVVRTTLTVAGERAPFTTERVFDPQRRVVRRTLPDGAVATATYAGTRLVEQALGGARVSRPLADHDAFGLPTTVRHGTGSTTTTTRSPAGALVAERIDGAGGRVLDLRYTRDRLGRTTAVDDVLDPDRSTAYGYHDQRLVRFSAGADALYEYDQSGNVRGKDGVSYDYHAHFARSGTRDGDAVYRAAQDACGRTATREWDGTRLAFAYDGLGALREVREVDGPPVLTVLTDHRGHALRRTARDGAVEVVVDDDYRVLRDPGGAEVVERYLLDGSGAVALVTGAAGVETTTYFHRDPKGSTTHVLDQAGAVLARVSYDPYGRWRQEVGAALPGRAYENRRWLPDVGLYDFGGRYYDPERGRFLTPDPGPGTSDPLRADALNRFAFELDDPVDRVDPSGYSTDWIGGLVLGAVLVVGGVAVIASGGALGPAVALVASTAVAEIATGVVVTLGYAALSAGLSAASYSLGHTKVSGGRFWAGLAVNAAVGAVAGAATAGLGTALYAGVTAALLRTAASQWAADLAGVGAYAAYGAITGATNGVLLQLTANGVDRDIVGLDVGLADGLGESALWGGIAGGIAGATGAALQAGGGRYQRWRFPRQGNAPRELSWDEIGVQGSTNLVANTLWMGTASVYELYRSLVPQPWHLFS